MRLPALLLAALLLAGCAETTAPDNVQEAVQAATEAVAGTVLTGGAGFAAPKKVP